MERQESASSIKQNHNSSAKLEKKQSDSKDPPHELDAKKRYKRCCLKCKHTEKGRRSCVCVVPLSQRRTQIGSTGCQTCGCSGCSIEDYIHRGQDPQYKPDQKNQTSYDNSFQARNGCCKQCMKAFSKNNKSCLCQVPKQVRKSQLPSSGCKVCHCHGCHPEDRKQYSRSSSEVSHSRPKKRKYRGSSSSSSSSKSSYNNDNDNLLNMQRSAIGIAISQAGLYAPMLGLGIPQRTYSYILGKPASK